MSTVGQGIRDRWLEDFDLPDWARDMTAIRDVYCCAEFWPWVDSRDDLFVEDETSRRSPFDQIESILVDFRCAVPPPGADAVRRMIPNPQGVWKLHSRGIRLFGWVPEPNTFVVVSGETKDRLNRPEYDRHLQGVVAFRKLRGMDSGYIAGDYRAVFTR